MDIVRLDSLLKSNVAIQIVYYEVFIIWYDQGAQAWVIKVVIMVGHDKGSDWTF